MRKDRRSCFGAKLETQNEDGETQPSYYFCAYHCFGNPFSCITAVKRVANDVENSSGKANDAIRAALLRKRDYSLCDETALLRHRSLNACAIAKNSSR